MIQLQTKEQLAKEYTDSRHHLIANYLSSPDEYKAFIAGYDAALSSFKNNPEASFLVNALMLLDNKGLKSLADNIHSRLPKEDNEKIQ